MWSEKRDLNPKIIDEFLLNSPNHKIKKKEKKGGFPNILVAALVSGTHVGIARIITPRNVISVCNTNKASL